MNGRYILITGPNRFQNRTVYYTVKAILPQPGGHWVSGVVFLPAFFSVASRSALCRGKGHYHSPTIFLMSSEVGIWKYVHTLETVQLLYSVSSHGSPKYLKMSNLNSSSNFSITYKFKNYFFLEILAFLVCAHILFGDIASLTSYQASDLWASSQQHVLITMLKVLLRHSTQTCFVSFPFWALYPSPNNLMAPPLVRFFSLSLFNQLKGFIGTLLLF